MRGLLLATLLLTVTGCQMQQLQESTDAGRALEKEGRSFERGKEFSQAAAKYQEASVKYAEALAIARERSNEVFDSFLNTKLSIVKQGKARCVRPDNDPAGDWDVAFGLYAESAEHAQVVSLLKLKGIGRSGQAYCRRPDKNPKGEWAQAAALYAEAAELAKEYEGDEERGEALRLHAICLLEGKTSELTKETRRLLEKARDLGDEEAAELLSASEGTYCRACGEALEPAQKFCGRCGHDQAKSPTPERKETPPDEAPPRMGPGSGAPGGPGGGAN